MRSDSDLGKEEAESLTSQWANEKQNIRIGIDVTFSHSLLAGPRHLYRAWGLLTEMPDWIPAYEYISIIGQAALYLMAFVLSMVFGYSVITAQDKQRMKSKRLAFVAILILMVAFEMPFYPCTNFHPSRHSLWECYRFHFHWNEDVRQNSELDYPDLSVNCVLFWAITKS